MHIAIANYVYSPHLAGAEALLDAYRSLTGWAEGLRQAGARVTVVQRFRHDADFEHRGVTYRMVADRWPPRLRGWQLPVRMHRFIRANEPTVVHLNGLLFPLQARLLRATLPARCALVLQHHAEAPWRAGRRVLQRWGLRAADGFLFAHRELARPWLRRRVIGSPDLVYPVMEASTHFRRHDRKRARARTRLSGEPVVLWVGRLDCNKDPLTVLAGFAQVVAARPAARLYMIYATEPLLPSVRARIQADPHLRDSVRLLGRMPHPQMEDYYSSADLFVLGSHHEGSGYALLEALACGVPPVVTDIPTFRSMTDQGRLGVLWSPGDADGFAAALLAAMQQPREPASRAASAFFERRLSYPAISRQALLAYREAAARRASGVPERR